MGQPHFEIWSALPCTLSSLPLTPSLRCPDRCPRYPFRVAAMEAEAHPNMKIAAAALASEVVLPRYDQAPSNLASTHLRSPTSPVTLCTGRRSTPVGSFSASSGCNNRSNETREGDANHWFGTSFQATHLLGPTRLRSSPEFRVPLPP